MKPTLQQIERLGQLDIQDEKGTVFKLKTLWKEQTAVLIFVRHFG